MRKLFAHIGLFAILMLFVFPVMGQAFDDDGIMVHSDSVLLEKEMTAGFILHSSGWGMEFRIGKNVTAFKKRMFEFDFVEIKSPKEVRVINPYFSNAKSYIYGKLNNIYLLRGGWGQQHLLNSKPYWGGVEVRAFYSGGLSLGLGKPVFLHIINLVSISQYYFEYELSTEKYDPEEHFRDNIYGRAAFVKGFDQIKLYPGIYMKAGFNFEFGSYTSAIKSLEVGASLDIFPNPIPLMAYNDPHYWFLNVYLSISFGKRFN